MTATTIGWLFINPLHLPDGARMWMLVPLVACVATVYRATRARHTRGMPRATLLTFVNIVVGMALIAAGFYGLHLAVRRFW
jgi:hypothetical protein